MITTSSLEEKFRSLVGGDHFRAARADETVGGLRPKFVVEPADELQLAAVLALANQEGLTVIPRGRGTKLDWGNPPQRADLILSTLSLNRVIDHAWADLTVTVEAGVPWQALQETLGQYRQRLALDVLWPKYATVGGVLSTNDNGALRLRFGALRDLIIGVTLVLPDGTIASSGGKVVKNVAGYDLPKLATGALGTLGVITRAVFRLHPMPQGARTFSFAANSIEEMQRLVLAIQDSKLAHTALQVRCSSGSQPLADILFEATDAGLAAQEAHLQKLLAPLSAQISPAQTWDARQRLTDGCAGGAALAKISFLPADLTETIKGVESFTRPRHVSWQAVLQATGIGTLLLECDFNILRIALRELRSEIEGRGGSLVLLRRPEELYDLDVWGAGGDALPLMRAVKHQLDAKSTLNPGRFVGRI